MQKSSSITIKENNRFSVELKIKILLDMIAEYLSRPFEHFQLFSSFDSSIGVHSTKTNVCEMPNHSQMHCGPTQSSLQQRILTTHYRLSHSRQHCVCACECVLYYWKGTGAYTRTWVWVSDCDCMGFVYGHSGDKFVLTKRPTPK